MSRIRSLSANEMNQGMKWINDNLTQYVTDENADYWYSRCLDKLGGLLSSHTRETDIRSHYWFRARAEDTFSEGEELLQESFLHPPAEVVGGGRANIPGSPVLYVSECLDDTLLETNLLGSEKEVRVALLEFSGKLQLDQFFFPKEFSNINGRVAGKAKEFFKPFEELMKGRSCKDKERAFQLHKLISNAYLDESHYFSSLVSHMRMYVHKQSDGIIYPSVKSLQMFNWALTTDISLRCRVHRAFKLKCHSDKTNEILEVGTPSHGSRIDWSLPTEDNMSVDPEFNFDSNYTPYKKPNKALHCTS